MAPHTRSGESMGLRPCQGVQRPGHLPTLQSGSTPNKGRGRYRTLPTFGTAAQTTLPRPLTTSKVTLGECGALSTRTTGDGTETPITTLRDGMQRPLPCEPLASPRRQSGLYHGISQRQVSRRLGGGETQTRVIGCPVSVTCRSCGAVFSAARASALYCGSACRVRAFRAKKRGLER